MPLAEVTNDHRMFFPFVGLALAVFWALRLILFRETARLTAHREWVSFGVAAVMLVLLAAAIGTRERNRVWRSEESLWRDVSIKSPKNGRGLMNYGLVLMGRGDYSGALSYFERALALTPNYASLEINLGIANGGLGRTAEAEQHFRRATALAPGAADPYFYYGRWLESVGRTTESASQLEAAVRVNRFAFDARDLLMRVYAELKNWQALDRLIAETLELAPDDATASEMLAARANRGQELAAAEQAARANATPESLVELSHLYFQAGRFEDSIAAAKKALALRPDYAEAYNNLAAAYNSMQRWDDGIQAAVQAIRLKPDFQLARNNLMWALGQREKAAGHAIPGKPTQ